MDLQALVDYLNDYLSVGTVPDYPNAHNGLQVFGPRDVQHVAVAVDATLYSITEAVRLGAELLLVHHGMLWGDSRPIVGTYYDRVASCIKSDLAVYSAHIPLDVHPDVGNNAVLMRRLGYEPQGTWAPYLQGLEVGVWTEADAALADLVERLEEVLGLPEKIFPFGSQHVMKFGVVTGGAGDARFIKMAKDMGFDLLITGEGNHSAVFEMEELGINCIYSGHYMTETVGVQALASHLESRFGLETFFIDHPSGL